MAMPIHLSKGELAAVAAHTGIRLDEETLTDYFELYFEHLVADACPAALQGILGE